MAGEIKILAIIDFFLNLNILVVGQDENYKLVLRLMIDFKEDNKKNNDEDR